MDKKKTVIIAGIIGLMVLVGGIVLYLNKRKQQAPLKAQAKKEEALDYLTSPNKDIIAQEEDD